MEEKLTMKQLFAILVAGLFSFCGVLIETATNITFPTLMNEFQVSTSFSSMDDYRKFINDGNSNSYFILFKKKISNKKNIFE